MKFNMSVLPSLEKRVEFFDNIKLPRAISIVRSRSFSGTRNVETFDDRKQSAMVIGDTLLSCMAGLSRDEKREIKNSISLARLMCNKYENLDVSLAQWMKTFAYTLNHVGWHLKRGMFEKDYEDFSGVVSEKMLEAVSELGDESMLRNSLDAFASLKSNSSALLAYSTSSLSGESFQVMPAGHDRAGNVTLMISHARLRAQQKTNQFLFFKWQKGSAKFRHHYASFTLDRSAYADTREKTEAILEAHALETIEFMT